jgi:diacylglycerol kinase
MTPPRRAQSRLNSFRCAFYGLGHALRSQPNTRIHASISAAVILLGVWLGIGLQGWAVLALAMGLVWVAELFNTALEGAVDLASPSEHPLAQTAKDTAAAAVLVASAVAVIVGLLVLGPPLWLRLAGG